MANNNTLLYQHCLNNQLQKVYDLLAQNHDDLDIMYKDGAFFRVAISNNSVELLSALLNHFEAIFADPKNQADYYAKKNHLCDILISGKNTHYISDEIDNAISAYTGSSENISEPDIPKENVLIPAIVSGKRDIINHLIDEAINEGTIDVLLMERNRNNESPVMCAIKRQYFKIAKKLIELDDNLDYRIPKTGKTAMMYAAENGAKEIMNLLFDNGASIYLADIDGDTVFDYAKDDSTKSTLVSLGYDKEALAHQKDVYHLSNIDISALDFDRVKTEYVNVCGENESDAINSDSA